MRKAICGAALTAALSIGLGVAPAAAQTGDNDNNDNNNNNNPVQRVDDASEDSDSGKLGLLGLLGLAGLIPLARRNDDRNRYAGRDREYAGAR